jgi:hypothetical protein
MNIERIKNFYQKYKLEILFSISTFIIALSNKELFSKVFILFTIIGIFAFLFFIILLIISGIYWLYEEYKENKNKEILDKLETND